MKNHIADAYQAGRAAWYSFDPANPHDLKSAPILFHAWANGLADENESYR